MPSVYDIKPAFQSLLRPLCRRMAESGIKPNQVTLAALLLSCLNGAAIVLSPELRWPLLVLPFTLLIRMGLNAIDGMLAREHRMQSRLGATLNELGDVVADAALFLPFALVPPVPAEPIVVLVLLSTLTEFAGVQAIQIGAERGYEGPFGKSDRAIFFGGLGLILGLGVPGGAWLTWLLSGACLLAVATIFNRAKRALSKEIRPS